MEKDEILLYVIIAGIIAAVIGAGIDTYSADVLLKQGSVLLKKKLHSLLHRRKKKEKMLCVKRRR